ncbi:23S rRNA (adenine2030-N6)-methyltransferase [Pseudidiomarina indica]|uniref:Ribosomal RNA large subunit methyltransferase J n=1 Tax=Pseudidiomarina indica TaxID=1159017 RepID=A0A1G6DVA7_9GAMM|nr:23S rRNA (adenine(2030)-N(6))-methyltransferase RlmJ [Pseudidiomarina indica]SDB49032.1 23S rRNA (adenine2030-N6)-methyltransferase [Pseudidiomarina indica]
MNYRHSYHAGNFADVLKHVVQCVALRYLQNKEKPFWVLDTHAGIGMYDLTGEEATKTGEAMAGVARLLERSDVPAAIAPYVEAVKQLNENGELRWYPGSPWLSALHLRPQDSLILCEKHPQDSLLLAANANEFPAARQIKVMTATDGYAALKALVPPPQKRGMVLIDPPFEQRDEFEQIVAALTAGVRRWATGTYAVWYPIKDPLVVGDFHQKVKVIRGVEQVYVMDLLVRSATDASRFNGCGMLFINPPYGLTEQATTIMNYLTPLLAQDQGAEYQCLWL